ncbi:AAD14_6 [Sanghuangporus vaninii]
MLLDKNYFYHIWWLGMCLIYFSSITSVEPRFELDPPPFFSATFFLQISLIVTRQFSVIVAKPRSAACARLFSGQIGGKHATPLGRFRVLSLLAGIRVSSIQLGAMSIGDKWENFEMGAMDKDSSFKLLDAYYDAGGKFIDTTNKSQDGTFEEFIGEWMEKKGIRDQMVIANKLKLSVEASLKKLRTSYIDILYIHWWDWQTSIENVMDNLHHLVVARKVLYLGVSDTLAWVASYANAYAKAHARTPFVIYQSAWNIMEHSFEREIIPMARTLGLALSTL